MKNLIKPLFIVIGMITLTSFTNAPTIDFIGTYGVSANDKSAIQLTLNENHSFVYKDFSDPDKQIEAAGNWVLKGNVVVLNEDNVSQYKFHNK